MKRTSTLLFALAITIFTFAQENTDAVSMVSYEQGWLDSEGTIALHNNTSKEIDKVEFQILYFDMNGKQLDYATFKSDKDIEPGMTKKIDIPAYEHDRNYSYYRSEAMSSSPHKFKIEFKLLNYDFEEEEIYEDDDNIMSADADDVVSVDTDDISDGVTIALIIFFVILFLGIAIGMYVLVGVMAKKRNRSVAVWVLLSLIASPLLMIIILLCIGDSDRGEFE